MKKVGTALLALSLSCSALTCAPLQAYCKHSNPECQLTQNERDKIMRELKFTIKKLHSALGRADKEARLITDIDIEMATRGAIAGAAAGIQAGNVYGFAISTCLGTMGAIAGDSFIHFRNSRKHVQDAQYFAYYADELQERLWRNQ